MNKKIIVMTLNSKKIAFYALANIFTKIEKIFVLHLLPGLEV